MAVITPEVRDLAARTAAVLRERGRYQGGWYTPESGSFVDPGDCPVCLSAAMSIAEDLPLSRVSPISTALGEVIMDRVRRLEWETFVTWNDDPATTDEEVLGHLDKIAGAE